MLLNISNYFLIVQIEKNKPGGIDINTNATHSTNNQIK